MEHQNQALLKEFKEAFHAAASAVYRKRSLEKSISQGDLLKAMVEASYLNLDHMIRTKLLLAGVITQAPKSPSQASEDRCKVAREILSLLESDLSRLDTKHEYTVGMVKRERRQL